MPELTVATVGGGTWSLAEQSPEHFTMVVFYRGYHCPICSKYLGDLDKKLAQFNEKGVSVVAISDDTRERAEKCKQDWNIENLTLGYDVGLAKAREWGLFVSSSKGKTSVGIEEPALFIEPGIFMIRPNGELYWSSVQTMPFARPHFAEILGALDFVIANDYPGRGEIVDLPQAAE